MSQGWPVILPLVVLLTACGTPPPDPVALPEPPSPTPTATGRSAPTPRPAASGNDPAFDLEVPVGQLPRDLTVHAGLLWVANARSASVWGVDPDSGAVVSQIATGPRPISFTSIGGQLWVSVLGPGSGIVGRGIARIDPETETVAQEVEVPVQHGLAASGGSIWVLDGERRAQRVDPSTGEVPTALDVEERPVAVDADDRWVWLVREDGTAVQIDVASSRVTAKLEIGAPAPGRSAVLLFDDEAWIAVTGRVHVLDAREATEIAVVEVEGLAGTTGIAAEGRSVWLASTLTEPNSALTKGVVLRIDRSTREITGRFDVAGEPAGLVLHGGNVWVADQERGVVLRMEQGM